MLRVLSTKKKRQFYDNQKGTTRSVLFEHENKDGYMFGFTENYLRVKAAFKEEYSNQILQTKINKMDDNGVFIFEPV
jgi:threonylcarbamoyladenosine tRNA methylthiotransferase MtaB